MFGLPSLSLFTNSAGTPTFSLLIITISINIAFVLKYSYAFKYSSSSNESEIDLEENTFVVLEYVKNPAKYEYAKSFEK